jgi:radical SAM superfamily enzyme YgiQ (UPF0313 family)
LAHKILLVTPPFTQLNTPYPATAYLKGFLNTKNISSFQIDLGIEVMLNIFCKQGLQKMFAAIDKRQTFSDNAQRIMSLKENYVSTIDAVILFLQGKNATFANQLVQQQFLPQASRFKQLDDMAWAFGSMGIQDKAKHLATLYLEDISDFIKECVDTHFGFSRYAERLGRSANSFDELYANLNAPLTYVDNITLAIIKTYVEISTPKLVAISVPFPGNLYSAFRCAQWLKQHHPNIKVAMGGGFPNTELRSLKDKRVFEFFDVITLDDGETPIEHLTEWIDGKRPISMLKRTFALENNQVAYHNISLQRDYKQSEIGTPDYSDFKLEQYISAIEIINPMHRLWSDGRWNKLTMAHGCYWGKCTFCDVSLDYIKNYEPVAATILCDRMEIMIAQTGEHGFHFVDEAAPPALMKALALEILKRKLIVTWWTNIRFEKNFTSDLCYLLKASGCIAVSGGLEVASDRLLTLIDKGITVKQVAQVTQSFTQSGIMVHAYLMYGFPTQTAQETIDSLEMVRQLFKTGVLQSGFWHQFTMTAHSPVGLNPEKYKVVKAKEIDIQFANNDVEHIDTTGTKHEQFGFGLQKSLLNYMHQIGLDEPLQKWFDMKVPSTQIESDYIERCLNEAYLPNIHINAKAYWLGILPSISFFSKSKKGQQWRMSNLHFESNSASIELKLSELQGKWLLKLLSEITFLSDPKISFQDIKLSYENNNVDDDFELIWYNKIYPTLKGAGLICV